MLLNVDSENPVWPWTAVVHESTGSGTIGASSMQKSHHLFTIHHSFLYDVDQADGAIFLLPDGGDIPPIFT